MLPDTWIYARTSYFKVLKKAKNIGKVNSAVNLALTSNFQTMRTNLQILYLCAHNACWKNLMTGPVQD